MTWKRAPLPTREQRIAARQCRVLTPAGCSAVMGGSTTGPAPKEAPLESAAYENAVRDLGECMRCGRRCRPQFCHRDEGKGTGIKTDVREGWAGCPACHALLGGHDGTARMPKEERRAEELRLGYRTRCFLRARGTWPKSVPMREH